MLIGRYGDTTGQPYIEGLISLPRLGLQSVPVSFLVDTGAGRCILSAVDARTMGIEPEDLIGDYPVYGIGGADTCFEEEAYLAFVDEATGRICYYSVTLLIGKREPEGGKALPSILGREILHRWRMFYFPHNPEPSLQFEVVSDDLSLDPGGRA